MINSPFLLTNKWHEEKKKKGKVLKVKRDLGYITTKSMCGPYVTPVSIKSTVKRCFEIIRKS